MKIDLHIHTKSGSDGNLSIEEVFKEAKKRNIGLISITDHDSIEYQEKAIALARECSISYITGVELNITLPHPNDRSVFLDFLGYGFDSKNQELKNKLQLIRNHREKRAARILEKLNVEFKKEGIKSFTAKDIQKIRDSVDGVFGRQHIANYLIEKEIVQDAQEAFGKYMIKCDFPKYPLLLVEASKLVRNAGGVLVIAHPNDPNGTSLIAITDDLSKQTEVIERQMLDLIDGVECWHPRHNANTTAHYIDFAEKQGLLITGGSDCHQKPVLIGTLNIPAYVAGQFNG